MTHPIQYFAPLWTYLAKCGDIEPHVFFASRAGLEQTFDSGFGQNVSWDIPLLDGYEHTFCNSRMLPGMRGLAANWPTGLRAYFQRTKFSAALIHGYSTAAAWSGTLAATGTGTPLLIRGDTHSKARVPNARSAMRRIVFQNTYARFVSAAIAIGQWNREFWIENGISPDRTEVATYAVDNDRLRRNLASAPDRARSLRCNWVHAESDVVILFCAKLMQLKRLDLLLRALAHLKTPRAVVVVVGSGPKQDEWEQFAKQLNVRTIWEGFVNQSDLPFYYAAADIQVLPSDHEAWGLVVNEGLACGCPCIVSSVVGAGPDLIERSGAGAVFDSGSVDSLASALCDALDDVTRAAWRSRCASALSGATYESFAAALRRLEERRLLRSV